MWFEEGVVFSEERLQHRLNPMSVRDVNSLVTSLTLPAADDHLDEGLAIII